MLLIDHVEEALEKVKEQVEEEFNNEHPYAVVSLNWVKNDLGISRRSGVDFLLRKLKEEYRVGKDGTWLIIEEE